MIPHVIDFVRHYVLTLSALGRFGLTLVLLVFIPRLCRRASPTAVGLLLSGVIVGPYVLGFFGTNRPRDMRSAVWSHALHTRYQAILNFQGFSRAPLSVRSAILDRGPRSRDSKIQSGRPRFTPPFFFLSRFLV